MKINILFKSLFEVKILYVRDHLRLELDFFSSQLMHKQWGWGMDVKKGSVDHNLKAMFAYKKNLKAIFG